MERHRGGDRRRRPLAARRATDERTEVGRLGLALNKMLGQIERAFAERRGERGAPAPLRGRRLARAAHAAELDPRLRRALSHGRRPPSPAAGAAMGRIEDERRAWAAWSRTCWRWPGSTSCASRFASRSTSRALPTRLATTPAPSPDGPTHSRGRWPGRGPRRPRSARQLVTNLLRNAIISHAARDRRSTSRLATRAGRSAPLQVRDYGPGLEPGSEERIFERFWRREASGHPVSGAALDWPSSPRSPRPRGR